MNEYILGAAVGMYVLGAFGFWFVLLQSPEAIETRIDRLMTALTVVLWPIAVLLVAVWILRDMVVDAWDARRSE